MITDRPEEINKRSALGLMKTDLYFCYSYCSRQKGTIANTTGLIRVMFPKQTNFDNISGTQIQQGKDWINNRSKKHLNYFTPKEVFTSSVALAT